MPRLCLHCRYTVKSHTALGWILFPFLGRPLRSWCAYLAAHIFYLHWLLERANNSPSSLTWSNHHILLPLGLISSSLSHILASPHFYIKESNLMLLVVPILSLSLFPHFFSLWRITSLGAPTTMSYSHMVNTFVTV